MRSVSTTVTSVLIASFGMVSCASTSTSSTSTPSANTLATTSPASTPTTEAAAGPGDVLHGKRYCEILLVHPVNGRPIADVYNTYPLNDCPAAAWTALDPAAVATTEGVPVALRNGPRYWLMDHIEKQGAASERVTKTFGGIEMILEATVDVGDALAGATPYTPHEVTRSTVFTFDSGSTVHELVAADGTTYVMQTWSQQIDPSLAETDLAGIGPRLKLPSGWTFRSRELTAPLKVVTVDTPAKVLQDDLMNSYSQETAG